MMTPTQRNRELIADFAAEWAVLDEAQMVRTRWSAPQMRAAWRFADFAPVIPPQVLRKQLRMTQAEFARALRIPIAKLRNWEQSRVLPDPAARSLLTIVARNPRAALRALAA